MNKIFKNWQIKLLSLILASCIYIVINFISLTTREVGIPLNVIENTNYKAKSYIDENVKVIIKGDQKITYLVEEERLKATLDLTNVDKEGIITLPIKLEYLGPKTIYDKLNFTLKPMSIRILFGKR